MLLTRFLLCLVAITALWPSVCARTPQYWEEQVLAYQLELQEDLPYNALVQPYAHNAFNGPNLDYTGDPFKRPTPAMLHQLRTIPELLDIGIRHISLEVHWIQELGAGNELHVCRTPEVGEEELTTFCAGSEAQRTFCLLAGIDTSFGSDTGCWRAWDRPLSAHLNTINTWLTDPANSGEFVHVQLIWRLNSTAPHNDDENAAMTRTENYLNTIFGNRVFRPTHLTSPAWPSLATLKSQGHRVLVSCVFNCPVSTWVFTNMNAQTWRSTHLSLFEPEQCCSRALDPTCSTSVPEGEFYWIAEDLTSLGNDTVTNINSFDSLANFHALGCGVHTARDRIDYPIIGDLSWTWAPGFPLAAVPGSECAVILTGAQRWESRSCTDFLRHACKTTTGTWVASSSASSGTSATCPPDSTYATPRTPQETRAIAALAQAAGVDLWVNAAPMAAALPFGPEVPPRNATFTLGSREHIPTVTPRELQPVSDSRERFCALPPTALFFDECRWEQYGQSVASRTAGMIALAAIGLAISCVFGAIIFCCCLRCLCCGKFRKKAKDRDLDINDGPMDKRYFLFIIPFALIIAGSVCLFLGNREIDLMSKNFTSTLRDRSDQIGLVKFTLDASLANLSGIDSSGRLNITTLTGDVAEGFEYLQDNIGSFSHGIDQWSLGRNIVTVLISILALFFLVVGIIVMIRRRHCLLILLLMAVNFIVFLSFITVLFNSVTDTVVKDMCHEVDRPAGLFDVLQSKAVLALNELTNFANSSLDRVTIQGCERLDQVCSYGFQVCSSQPCNIDLLLAIGETVTINDDGNQILLKDCPISCGDAQLRSLTTDFAIGVLVYEMYISVMSTLNTLIAGFIGETMRGYLNKILCVDLAKALPLIYTGGALLMAGLLTQLGLTFWLGWKKHKLL